jgi:hypothetical protein
VFTEIFAGQLLITGATLSITVIVKLQSTLPHEFVAVTFTFVVPELNINPLPVPEPDPVVAPVKVYV